jgi:hypothetical protein
MTRATGHSVRLVRLPDASGISSWRNLDSPCSHVTLQIFWANKKRAALLGSPVSRLQSVQQTRALP